MFSYYSFNSHFTLQIVFDECHRAKNLQPVESGKATKTGLTVKDLQNKLPNARVVYASATGASEPKNMAYMVRLGLWGPGTSFTTFNDFVNAIEKRGVGAMEIVAMDMKLRGMYIARQLSFHGVSFRIETAYLDDEFKRMYNDSVRLWVRALNWFSEAIGYQTSENSVKVHTMAQFWAAHQRFFKYLCIASKVKLAVRLARDSIKNNRCVVIGLQSTGEARTLEQLEKEDGELSEFVSTAKGVLENLVDKHFPASNEDRVNRILALAQNKKSGGNHKSSSRKPAKRKKVDSAFITGDDEMSDSGDESFDDEAMDREIQRCFQKKDVAEDSSLTNKRKYYETVSQTARDKKATLMRQVHGLGKRMPSNTLDTLIDELGGKDNVAELTGRKGRVVQSDYGKITYETRSDGEVSQEMINLSEKEKFMSGEKEVAIISEAASSGISLQSDRRVANQKKRVHITLELPWSADRAIQQFGRTHRSNQASPPEYIFIISELAGERRFASIVAKRLESMGALTHGDRRTADTRDLSSFNIDNEYGKDALSKALHTIMGYEKIEVPFPESYGENFVKDVKEGLVGCGLATNHGGCYSLEKDATNNITKFLNR